MALRKRVLRTLLENKGRYIGIFILIFIGSFSFLFFRGFSGNYARLINEFAEENKQEDVSFTTYEPIADVPALEREVGAIIETHRHYDVQLPEERELRLIGLTETVNKPQALTGRDLANPGEMMLSPGFFNSNGYQIGDKIEVGGKTFTVIGTAALPDYVYILKYVNDVMAPPGFGVGVVSAEELAYPDAVTVYAVRFNDRANVKAQVSGLYNALVGKGISLSEWMDASTNKRIRMPWATISGMQAMSVPVPTAMFLLSCLIVGLMIRRIVRSESVIIGILHAQGYRRKELVRHYLSIPVLISAAAGVSGVLLALPLIAPSVKVMATLYYTVPYENIAISFLDIALGILMPVSFLGIACLLVIRQELNKPPAELMKGSREKAKANIFERVLKLESLPFDLKFKVREQLRSVSRLLFLLFGVMAASFIMLIGFAINHSMNVVFSGESDAEFNYSWEYAFKELQQGEPSPGAVPFNAIRCYPAGRETVEFYLSGIITDVPYVSDLLDAKGNELPKGQVNITSLLANRLRIGVGDELTVVNRLDGKEYSLVIDGIVQTYSGQFVYMPLSGFNKMLGMPEGSYSGVFSEETQNYDPAVLSGAKDLRNVTNTMDELMMPMMTVIIGLAVLGALIGAIIIFLVISLTIEESRSSISLLKIFGYRSKEVKKLMLGSSRPIVIIGFLLSIPVMLASMNAMYAYLGEMINIALPILLSPGYVVISFVLIYGVFELSKLLCARKLAAITMSEALKAGAE
jgi:putative ABC transport system permease protein